MFERKNSLSQERKSPGEAQPKAPLLPIIVLLFNTGIMWFGFFMLIPLLAVHITRDLMLGAALAGLVLAIRQFVQQGSGFFIGAVADWVGYRRTMMTGMIIRAAGFVWLAVATDPFGLIMGSIVAAIGGSMFDSSGKAALVYVSKGYERATIFSLSSTIGNIGMATGPLAGVALLKVDFKIVGLVSASIYLVACFMLAVFVPPMHNQHEQGKPTAAAIFGQMGEVIANRKFLVITGLMTGFFFLATQINITITLLAVKLSGSEDSVGLVYLLNSSMAIIFQFFMIKMFAKWLQPVAIIAIGTTLTTIGIASFSFANSFALFILFLVIYSLGRLFVEPISSTITAQYAREDNIASYFGFSSLAIGVGGMLGSLLGGWLFDTSYSIGFPALCWLVFGAVGTVVIAGTLWVLWREKHPNLKEAPIVMVEQPKVIA